MSVVIPVVDVDALTVDTAANDIRRVSFVHAVHTNDDVDDSMLCSKLAAPYITSPSTN